MDLPRAAAHLARLDRALGPRRPRGELEVIREEHRERCVFIIPVLVSSVLTVVPHARQAHLWHYTEPATEPLLRRLALSKARSSRYDKERATPAAYPSLSQIENTDLFDVGTSGMGSMVKGREGRRMGVHRRYHASTVHNLLKPHASFRWLPDSFLILKAWRAAYGECIFYMKPLPTRDSVLHQYGSHVLPFLPVTALDSTLNITAAPVHILFQFVCKPNALNRNVVPATVGETSLCYGRL